MIEPARLRFIEDAISRMQKYLSMHQPKVDLLQTRLVDLEIDSLDYVEWEMELYDHYAIDGEIEPGSEQDTVENVLLRYAESLKE